MLISDGSPIRHVGLQRGMLVFNGAFRSPMGHVGLQWGMSVSDGAYQFPMKLVEVSDGSPIRHVGLRWVSDRSLIVILFL